MRDFQLITPGKHWESVGFPTSPFILVASEKADLLATELKDAGFAVKLASGTFNVCDFDNDDAENDNASFIELDSETNIPELKKWLRNQH